MHGRRAPEPHPAGGQRSARALRRQGLRRPTVPRNVRLSEAPSFGKPILLYDVASKGAQQLPRSGARIPGAPAGRAGGRGGRAMSAPKRKALGRGLAALIPGAPSPASTAVGPALAPGARRRACGDGLRTVAIEDVHPATRAAAQDLRRRAPGGAGGVDPHAGDHPAAGRARARRRRLRADRGRAALAGRPAAPGCTRCRW